MIKRAGALLPVLTGLGDLARRFLRYDRETGDLYWIDPGPEGFSSRRAYLSFKGRWVGKKAGGINKQGYVHVAINKRSYQAHRLIWAMETGVDPSCDIDHRDECKSNNRFGNLREATRSQNKMNVGPNRNNRSGVKGVFPMPSGKWGSCIMKDGKNRHLGTFVTIEEAKAAYDLACAELHGEFANFGASR